MLYIVGLGLNPEGISKEGLEIVQRCKKVYLEKYTVDFPYSEAELEEKLEKKFVSVDRVFVENFEFIDEAKKQSVALLVYGSPLTATTHITILEECKKSGIKCKVIHSTSIFDAVAETGLQLYKFGKVTSMPAWKQSYEPTSFMETIKENASIKAHSLILMDIGLELKDAIKQLEISAKENEFKINKIILCQALGTRNSKIFYRTLDELKEFNSVLKPYCMIIPGTLHHLEKEVLEEFG